jgi:DNA polymerase III delta subunit
VEYRDGATVGADEVEAILRGAGTIPGEPAALLVLENSDQVDLTWLLGTPSRDLPTALIAVGTEESIAASDPRYTAFFKRTSAKAVVCKSRNPAKLINWVQRRLSCDRDTASVFLESSGGDTEWLAQELHKIGSLNVGEALRGGHVRAVTSPTSVGDFIANLLEGNRRGACRSLPTAKTSKALFRSLEDIAVKGALVYEAQKSTGLSARQLSSRTGLSLTELAMLRAHINTFGRRSTERRLRALAKVSVRAVRGDRQAWLTLVALW